MARRERYNPEQWKYMNLPDTQVRIRAALSNYLRSFLDTATEGGELTRAREVFQMIKEYFEREPRLAEEQPEPDRERADIAETVLIPLGSYFRIAGKFEAGVANAPPRAELSAEELDEKIEEWQRFEERLRQEGREHWWD